MPPGRRRAWWAIASALATFAVSSRASADKNLGPQGSAIKTSHYTIDLYEGPVIAGARVVGLAGAYVPISEGVAGYFVNPASVAQRVPWSIDWFDWDLDGGFTLGASISGFDYDNSGDGKYTNSAALFLTGGGGLQFGAIGVGANLDFQQYRIKAKPLPGQTAEEQTLDANVTRGVLDVGYGFFRGQLVLGLGIGFSQVTLTRPAAAGKAATEIAAVGGLSGYAGALWQPPKLPIRAGASVRLSPPASADTKSKPSGADVVVDAEGNYTSQGYYLPRTISLPSEINAGVAFQLFRPMNFPWVSPRDEDSEKKRVTREVADERAAREADHEKRIAEGKVPAAELEREFDREDERAEELEAKRIKAAKKADHVRRRQPYLTMPREKLLVSVAVKMTTITTNGVGLESFLTQKVARSGEEFSFSPRLGIEGEAVPRYLVLRGGTYYEPSRFREPAGPRVHGTFGLDVRIPIVWSVFGLLEDDNTFRVGGALDGALNYFGWGVSAGIWR